MSNLSNYRRELYRIAGVTPPDDIDEKAERYLAEKEAREALENSYCPICQKNPNDGSEPLEHMNCTYA
jgi:hypothetical protein